MPLIKPSGAASVWRHLARHDSVGIHENGSKERPLSALSSSRSGEGANASTSGDPSETPTATSEEISPLARLVAERLEQDKAEDILEIDLTGKSPMADSMVVASGRSHRHVTALADHVSKELKDHGARSVRVEGLPNADWVLIDAGDVIVHIFRPEVREFYNLERIWGPDATSPANS